MSAVPFVLSALTQGLLLVAGVVTLVFAALAPPGRRGLTLTGGGLITAGGLAHVLRLLAYEGIYSLAPAHTLLVQPLFPQLAGLCVLAGVAVLGLAVTTTVRGGA